MRLVLLPFVTLLVACSTLTATEKAERQANTALAVQEAIARQHYKVEINMMYPRQGKAAAVSPDFFLEVKGDTLVSYLPYCGRAYNVPYGGGKGLCFTAPIHDYQSGQSKNGATWITMKVNNEEDLLSFRLEIFSGGNTTIDLTSHNRESISYSGTLE